MRVLFFIESLQSGGKERRLIQLIDYMMKSGQHEVMLVLMSEEIHFREIHELGVKMSVLKRKYGRKDPVIFSSFFKMARGFKPDVIHTWGIMNTVYALPVSLLRRVPVVNSIITNVEPGYRKGSLTHFFASVSFRFSSVILANSYAGIKAYGVGDNKTKVIHNGINMDRFKARMDVIAFRKHLELEGMLIVTMVASINEKKNHHLLLDIAKQIGQIRKDVRFLVVGDGPMREVLEGRMDNEQIDNVVMLGKRNDVELITSTSDIGVLFTHNEGFPNSVMEFMASGKPVMVSDAGGSKELVLHEKVGYLINNDRMEDIINKLLKLIDDPGLREKMGVEGHELIKEQFPIEKMSEAHLKVYSELI